MELFDDKILKDIRSGLSGLKQTISIAESVTTGMLQLAIGSINDASDFYQGGITTYNVAQKYNHLDVEPIHALSCDCVSGKVAQEMATGCCRLFKSNWGIGITGYASPVPESGQKIFAYYAIVCDDKLLAEDKITATSNTPFAVQQFYVTTILEKLVALLNRSGK